MSAELVLHDQFLSSMLANPAVLQNFEQLRQFKKASDDAAHNKCGSCGEATRAGAALKQQMRQFIIQLPDNELNKLKAILGIPPTRKFMTYIQQGRKNQRVSR